MEPKSKAFYTAVAISILAVLGATIFPTLVQAVQATTATQTADEDSADQGAAEGGGGDEADDGAAEQGETAQRAADDAQSQQSEDTGSDETTDESGTSDGPALASSDGMVSCGEVITRDVTLQQDLSCPDDGLKIDTNGVTLNLNGHTITSNDGDDNSVDLTMDVDGNSGILVTADDVTILGVGSILNFDTGIAFIGSSGGKVSDVTLRENGIGAAVSGSDSTYISKNSIDTNDYGVVSESSNHVVVSFNQIVSNGEAGIVYLDSSMGVIAGNGVFGNGETGIFLNDQSTENTVDYNIVFGHSEADMNNGNGMATNLNDNTFGENNKCGTSTPGGLC
jgi:parallel beta-helix repeat protein